MKNFNKKLISLLLVLAIVLSACGKMPAEYQSKNNSQTDISSSVLPDDSKTDQKENAKEDEPRQNQADTPANQNNVSTELSDREVAFHFIDVGQADSTLIISGSQTMMIDTGNRGDSQLLLSYLEGLEIDYLDYLVLTHPHEDHIGSAKKLVENVEIGTVYMMSYDYTTNLAAELVNAIKDQGITTIEPTPGDQLNLGSSHILFLGPAKDYSDVNDDSISLKLTHGELTAIFTGDATSVAERDMIEAGFDLEADLLHVGHHGSSTSSSYYFLREVNPEYAIISCEQDNQYDHPHENVLSRLNDVGAVIYRTDQQGTIQAISDGQNLTFNTEGTVPTRDHQKDFDEASYIGNINSKKFHLPSCSNLPAEDNRVYFAERDTAVEKGYDPCGNCKP